MLGNNDQAHFSKIWKRRLQGAASEYVVGANLRVDTAIRLVGQGRRLLDVGCGSGILLDQLRGRFAELYGVDVSPEAVEAARLRGIAAAVVNLNAERLPYPDLYFQAVTILSTLQYFFDPGLILQEVSRVLLPSALLLISVPNMRAFWRIGRLFLQGSFPRVSLDREGYDGGTLHYFAFTNLRQLLEANGFRVASSLGIFCLPHFLEGIGDRGPIGIIKREFFSAETFIVASKN